MFRAILLTAIAIVAINIDAASNDDTLTPQDESQHQQASADPAAQSTKTKPTSPIESEYVIHKRTLASHLGLIGDADVEFSAPRDMRSRYMNEMKLDDTEALKPNPKQMNN